MDVENILFPKCSCKTCGSSKQTSLQGRRHRSGKLYVPHFPLNIYEFQCAFHVVNSRRHTKPPRTHSRNFHRHHHTPKTKQHNLKIVRQNGMCADDARVQPPWSAANVGETLFASYLQHVTVVWPHT